MAFQENITHSTCPMVGPLAERDLDKDVFKKLHHLYKVCNEVELIPDQRKRQNDSVRQEVMETGHL